MRWINCNRIISFIIVLFIVSSPIQTFAAEMGKLIPMGHSIGIHLHLKGVFITNDVLINDDQWLKAGDFVQTINEEKVNKQKDIQAIVKNIPSGQSVIFTVKRSDRTLNFNVTKEDLQNFYPFLRDQTEGIGTLTYIDPKNGEYGALGHQIIDATLKTPPAFVNGSIYLATIEQIKKSTPGHPGYKISTVLKEENPLGTIKTNQIYGIFGDWKSTNKSDLPKPLEVMKENEVKIGEASIYTTIEGKKVEKFSIMITTVKSDTFQFELTDDQLISKTGGILQGMSGSPIIQNGRFAGVITHMFVEDPTKGAALPMTQMLKKQP